MARICVSSTYGDLKDHREHVYRALRQLSHDVIAMEDYVAADRGGWDRAALETDPVRWGSRTPPRRICPSSAFPVWEEP